MKPEMDAKDDLQRMKDDALEIASYYYKGFGSALQGILANAEEFLEEPTREELSEKSYRLFREVEQHYEKIPFEDLRGREEFYPLFIVRRLLPHLKKNMDEVFMERNKFSLHNLLTNTGSIVNVGNLYRDSFQTALKQIRANPEAKNFRINIIDHKGREYVF